MLNKAYLGLLAFAPDSTCASVSQQGLKPSKWVGNSLAHQKETRTYRSIDLIWIESSTNSIDCLKLLMCAKPQLVQDKEEGWNLHDDEKVSGPLWPWPLLLKDLCFALVQRLKWCLVKYLTIVTCRDSLAFKLQKRRIQLQIICLCVIKHIFVTLLPVCFNLQPHLRGSPLVSPHGLLRRLTVNLPLTPLTSLAGRVEVLLSVPVRPALPAQECGHCRLCLFPEAVRYSSLAAPGSPPLPTGPPPETHQAARA